MQHIIAVFFLIAFCPVSAAAPWVQDRNDFYTRVSLSFEHVAGLERTRLDTYAKFGLTSKSTVFVKSDVVTYPAAPDFNGVDWRIGVRRKLYSHRGFVLSGEMSFLHDRSGAFSADCKAGPGNEVRTGAGWGGQLWGKRTFLFAETAKRFHKDCQREYYDFGIGQTVSNNIETITQFWVVRKGHDTLSQKIQSEIVWKGRHAHYAIGYRQENSGLFTERGVFVALAKHF